MSAHVLEVCVDSFESATNAVAGGPCRLELCQALSEGGLTPSVGLVRSVLQEIEAPIHALIRPRRGDFLYTKPEIDAMVHDIEALSALGVHGFVFGALNADGSIDGDACRRLLSAAGEKPCTFHRAFDVSSGDPVDVLQELISLGFTRVLTSGRAATAMDGREVIKKMVEAAGARCVVMPGGGVNPENVGSLMSVTGCKEVHASCKAKVPSRMVFRNDACRMAGVVGRSVQQGAMDEYTLEVARKETVETIFAEIRAHLGSN